LFRASNDILYFLTLLGVCVPTALLTVLQILLKTAKAEENEEFNQELSLADFLIKYKEKVGIEYEDDLTSDHQDVRAKTLTEILLENGVLVDDNPAVSNSMHFCETLTCVQLIKHVL
jgi:hypothetical protein